MEEPSTLFRLDAVELDIEPHVAQPLLHQCVPLFGFHSPLVQTLEDNSCSAHRRTDEKLRPLINDMLHALLPLLLLIEIPRFTILIIDH